MTEEFLYYLWKLKLLKEPLFTVDGNEIIINNTGERNYDSGPDFLFTKIKIGDTTWAGNVEMHLRSSDWYRHHHDVDKAYDNVILHVVYQYDKPVFFQSGEEIPTLEVKGKFDRQIYENYLNLIRSDDTVACAKSVEKVSDLEKMFWLERVMTERFEEKSESIKNDLANSNSDFQEIFYQKLARSFGFKTNSDAFEQLARSLPLKILLKHIDNRLQIEALLYGQAGLLKGNYKEEYPVELKKEYDFLAQKYGLKKMPVGVWKFMRMRPVNFPTIRISQFAGLLYRSGGLFHKIPGMNHLSDVVALLRVSASGYWNNHYRFGKVSKGKEKTIGAASANLILINTVIPFVFVYGSWTNKPAMRQKALLWMEQINPENNKIVRIYKSMRFPIKNAMHSQAVIGLKKHYCDPKRCLDCQIGQKILGRITHNT
jgi:hypothetical protein